jgi:hypothetical protein
MGGARRKRAVNGWCTAHGALCTTRSAHGPTWCINAASSALWSDVAPRHHRQKGASVPSTDVTTTTRRSGTRTRTRKTAVVEAAGFERICNLVPSRKTEGDWRFEDALGAGALGAVTAMPRTVDLRRPWWGVHDQEDTGSCVGWAVADGVVRYHMVTAGKVDEDELLSPRHVWMASKETDEFTSFPETFIEGAGTSLKAALDVCRKYGTARNDDLPFHVATKMFTGPQNQFYASCARLKIASYFNLRKNLAQWKTWLASNGPILAGLSVDQTWDEATANGGKLTTFKPDTNRGGHAVAVVGYRTDGRFIIRNSWGTGWGDGGFGYASAAYIRGAFFDEAYGITV